MRAVIRLGRTPRERGDTTNVSGSPDILALDDGSYVVIGVDVTDEVSGLSELGARCAPNERVVRITRSTLVAARPDIPVE